ncbi:hypothetical protein [Burkholderia cenocepacia]|uniref:hypothetical protein n=1 Tax=Burkholderia cenocepacia TaxID=95486 RepID=UPI0028746472|nr:hypothetical protein [Burkholderia cenocepacia]MDS0801736.1 hypothetical protein [Burkholderia cenocepacia]
MTPNDKRAFKDALDLAHETARQALPTPAVLGVFWAQLEAYPLDAVLRALSRHVATSEFAPTPASILKHLPKMSDGRPEADEAWAIAIRSADERETVVWTQEIAEAWAIASPVFDGDEIGARMAFKAAYVRIVDRNRGANLPPQWVVSQGFDAQRRIEVVEQAVRAGRLQLTHAQAVVPLLASAADPEPNVDVETNLARLKAIVGGIGSAQARASAEKSARAREDAEHTAELKQAAARRVAGYRGEVTA